MRGFLFPVFILFFISHLPIVPLYGQSDTLGVANKSELVLGVQQQPPYIIKGENGTWDGISVRLWRSVADKLNLTYRFREVAPAAANQLLQQQKVDMLLLGHVTAEAEALLDFSHMYHTAELGVASSRTNQFSSIAKAFFSKRFWYTALSLSVLLLIVGAVVYFIERKSNDDNFGGERSALEGIGAGFWWAGVTMTTIGYGDKAPVTFWGRAVALLWMLVAMGVTAVLTASLVSVVMGDSGKGKLSVPADLRDKEVAAVDGSGAVAYLQQERISFKSFSSLSEALEAVNKGEQDLVLHNVPAMRYEINNNSDLALKVQSVKIDPHYYAFGLPSDSPLREPLNQALLQVINTPGWQQELDRFVPE